jgi:hypothetical protein
MECASENQATDNSAESTTESTFQHQQEIEEGMTYFNCKKCSCTITYNSIDGGNNYKENVDPNVPHSGICKSCTSAEKFQQSLVVTRTPGYSSAEDFSSPTFTSPLTQSSSSSVRSSSAVGGEGREEEEEQQQQSVLGNNVYSVGKTHLVALSVKAPKNSSNYNVMNFYSSIGVYDQDFEMQMKEGGINEKRIDKLYFGVDVIYRTDRKTFTSIPLLCPAKVYWDSLVGSDQSECEVIVGISYDTNNHVYPIVAVYDAFRQYKNLAKTKTLIHTKFSRMAPTSISHDFTEAELDHFSKELIKFLCIKSAVEVKEGKNLYIVLGSPKFIARILGPFFNSNIISHN